MFDGDPAAHAVAAAPGAGRGWRVLLICGASGVGKSRISYPLLHCWDTHPEARHFAAEEIVALQIALAESLSTAIAAVVGNHLETDTPVIIEGDFILPALAAMETAAGMPTTSLVRAIVMTESSTDQLVANYLQREPVM